jgi:hypothetical protein
MGENTQKDADYKNDNCVATALRSACENRAMVEVAVTGEHEHILPCYVTDVDEDSALLQCVTPGGHYCGYLVKRLDRIYRVIVGSLDARRAENLFRMRGVFHEAVEHCPGGNILALLQYAKSAGKVVSIELIESDQWDIMGFVTNVDGQAVTIRQVTNYAGNDGCASPYLEDITEVSCDDDGETGGRYFTVRFWFSHATINLPASIGS